MIRIHWLKWYPLWAAGILLVLAGCAAVDQPWRGDPSQQASGVRRCAQVFAVVDEAVALAGRGDAEAHRIAGFPYLRVDRFSAQFRDVAADGGAVQAQWVARLQALDQDARRVEINNLPDDDVLALEHGGRAALIETLARCADTLRDYDLALPQRMTALRSRAQVPDRYRSVQRAAGLYPLTRVPFYSGISQWQREALQDFRDTAAGRAPAQPLVRYAHASAPALTRGQIAAMLSRASDNPLRIPHYSREESNALAAAYAPAFAIESGGAYDRFGRLYWTDAEAPAVDVAVPVVYYRIAFARHSGYAGQTLTQLVYTVWFPERPADHALDVLAGKLDGILLRVTLSPGGEPLIYDSIHPCGCYHLFFPTERMQAIPAPQPMQEWAFTPARLPAHAAGTRLTLRIATRTHYIIGVSLDPPAGTQAYTLVPEDELRALPHGGRQAPRRSLYGPQGLVAGTERGERFLFWPMGIVSAGAMRQWGHHATAFVGRRHFDDADLIEKRFRVAGGAAP